VQQLLKVLPWIPLFFFAIGAKAQRPNALGIIAVNLFDSASGKALDGATVQVVLLGDSARRPTTALSQAGHVEFLGLGFGHYQLSVSYVGYATLVIDSIFLRPERYDFNLGDLRLVPKQEQGATVVVFSEKPLIENRDGKISYNVGESALSSGSNTAELLRNMPMVSNDPNGKLLLKGKEPRILIDDKPVELNGQQLNDLLEGLSGAGIERIEILQNPPPQYASEQGGVINIVTKKGKVGLTGKLAISAGSRGEVGTNANFAYRSPKLNFSGSVGVGGGQLLGSSHSERQNFYADSSNQFNTRSGSDNHFLRPNLRLQLDVDPNKNEQWSAVLQTNANLFDNESTTRYENINRFAELWRLSNRTNNTDGQSFNLNPQLSYRYRAKNPQHFVQIIASAGVGANLSNRNYNQVFLNPTTNAKLYDSTQEQRTNNQQHSYTLRINYNLPLRVKSLVFSAGTVVGSNHYHNVLNTYFFDKVTGQPNLSVLLSNDTRFVQNVYTARVGLVYDAKKSWRFTANLQAEQTQFRFSFEKLDGLQHGYFNLLPSATVRKDLNKQANLSLAYRKSIRRPAINELNPAVDYNDPYNLRFGNPTLVPNLAHNFDLNFGFSKGKSYINAAAGFNRVTNIINSIRTLQPDGKTFVTYQNIASKNEYELGVWGGYTVSKKLRFNMSGGFTYNQFAEADRKLLNYRNGITSYLALNYNLVFSPLCSMDGNFRYSSFADAQGRARSNLAMNLGVQYKFFKRRFVVAFNVTDPLLPQQQKTVSEGRSFLLNSFSQNRTKNYRLALSWAFSSKPKNAKAK
jgi:outer membrane receptor protein involved in Fe transport